MSNISGIRQKRVIIYSRVSTDEQAERGFSLSDQEERLRRYCESNNCEIVAHFQDDHSAKNFNRPAFQNMLMQLRSKVLKADLFLAVRYDRFSRNAELSLAMISELKKYGVQFNTVEQKVDLNNPESLLIHLINLGLPQVENERRAINTKRGMRRAQKLGRWMSTAPKGYSNVLRNGEKIIEPNEDAKLIKWAFEQIATGLYSIEDVRRQLWKKNCKISKSPFNRLVKNPVYMGKIRVSAWDDESEMIVEGEHEPIISEELFLSVQDILSGRKHTAKPKSRKNENFPLRGFLECPRCGGRLTASFSTGRSERYGYYHCQNGCKERQDSIELNKTFLDYLNSYEINDEVLNLYCLVLQDVFSKDRKDKEKEVSQIEDLIGSQKGKLDSLLDKFLENELSKSDYERGKKRFEDSIYSLECQKRELEIEEKDFMNTVLYSFGLLRDLPKYYEKSEIEVKHKILGSIFPEKLIYENKKYRTAQINSVLALICSNINSFGEIKEKRIAKFNNPSSFVARRGLNYMKLYLIR